MLHSISLGILDPQIFDVGLVHEDFEFVAVVNCAENVSLL